MSIGIVASNMNAGGVKNLTYGQGYGNYQNQNNAQDKTASGQFSMAHAANASVDKDVDTNVPVEESNKSEKVQVGECQTCKNRKYNDVSDDPGVSYQSPTKLSGENVASAVLAHEQEHVVRNQAKAEREDRKIVSQSVMLHSAVCPECGKSYVSGGTTRTVTKADNSNLEEKAKEVFFNADAGNGLGGMTDQRA